MRSQSDVPPMASFGEGFRYHITGLLHDRAGSNSVYEVHGHLREVVCPACHHVLPAEPFLDDFMATGKVPRCRRCHHIMKPNVVLFGELLPWKTMKAAQTHARAADVLRLAPGAVIELQEPLGGAVEVLAGGQPHLKHEQADDEKVADFMLIRQDILGNVECACHHRDGFVLVVFQRARGDNVGIISNRIAAASFKRKIGGKIFKQRIV